MSGDVPLFTPEKWLELQAAINNPTSSSGWGNYSDTVYTSGSPLSVLAATDTVLPNNKGSVIETYKQDNVTTYYDGTVVTGRTGDTIEFTVDLVAVPTSGAATYLEIWIDIGGGVGELYKRLITFPKGAGVERPVNFSVNGYTLNTWEANGATVYVRSDGPVNLYNIRYVIERSQYAA